MKRPTHAETQRRPWFDEAGATLVPMSRLPFDPSRMPPREASSPKPAEPSHLTVSQLSTLIERALTDHLPATLTVVGEIGQFRERTHWYFDLKDSGAVISCVMFASAARRVGFVPRVGQQVVLTGRVEFYAKQGRTTFMAEKLRPVGEGALDAALRRLVEDLRSLGWFADERKRPLPLFPRRVAVLTSRSGAALQDVLDTARRRCPAIPIAVIDARVQGEGAAEQIATAVRRISTRHRQLAVDVLLITRGGGSMEDLWCFNDRALAEAIVKCPIPVVAAIGHETDTTIAELVADMRAATPTQAAMRIFPDAAALRSQLGAMHSRMGALLSRHLRAERDRLRAVSRHPFLTDPGALISDRRDDMADDARRMSNAAQTALLHARARLDRAAVRLERHRPSEVYARRDARLRIASDRLRAAAETLLDRRLNTIDALGRAIGLVGPHSVLGRGYSVTLHDDGRVVRSARDVSPGQTVRTRLADGDFGSTVQGDAPRFAALPPAAPAAPRPVKAQRRPRTAARDQLDLFGPAQ